MDPNFSSKIFDVCRTCLREINHGSKISYLDTVPLNPESATITTKLKDCVPELDLSVTPNAAICGECTEAINLTHKFKKRCLKSEKDIRKYVRWMGIALKRVDLVQMLHVNKIRANIRPFPVAAAQQR
uniref:ZAD domain-containing protein n=1 Tax=Photinus pyralis TaxID=7054 RepID=A0A1Y1NKN7_PHOPY